MKRKAVIKHLPTQRSFSLSGLAGKPHFHFCRERDCRLVYEDRCGEPEENGLCQLHRGLRRALIAIRDPQECCIGNCVQVIEKEHIFRYLLAGPGPWFQCRTCARCHGWPCA